MELFIWILLSVFLVVTIIMIPIQVRYLRAIKEEMNKKKLSQDKYFDQMEFQEELLHMNSQGNLFFMPANFIAWLWLRMKKEI